MFLNVENRGHFVARSGADAGNSMAQEGIKKSWYEQSRTFVRESWAELKKVSFPTSAEATQATVVTVVIILVVSICLAVLDLVFGHIMLALVS